MFHSQVCYATALGSLRRIMRRMPSNWVFVVASEHVEVDERIAETEVEVEVEDEVAVVVDDAVAVVVVVAEVLLHLHLPTYYWLQEVAEAKT